MNDIAVERNARNAHRQRDFELKQLARLVKEDSSINQDMIEEKVIAGDQNKPQGRRVSRFAGKCFVCKVRDYYLRPSCALTLP